MNYTKLTSLAIFCLITVMISCSKNNETSCYNCARQIVETASPAHPDYPKESTEIFEECGTTSDIEALQEPKETSSTRSINGSEYLIKRVETTECK